MKKTPNVKPFPSINFWKEEDIDTVLSLRSRYAIEDVVLKQQGK